ncbi:MAG: hypothetical protein GAKPKEKM_01327 [Rhodocyclaceae bacterium]|nr:hypothetical protein [Rhodocyclaceae bacterium]
MSSTTWNSLLLSKGSIFSTTSCTRASDTETAMAAKMPSQSLRRAARSSSRRSIKRRKTAFNTEGTEDTENTEIFLIFSVPSVFSVFSVLKAVCFSLFSSFSASQGVTTKAMASEMNMPIEALMGIGLM